MLIEGTSADLVVTSIVVVIGIAEVANAIEVGIDALRAHVARAQVAVVGKPVPVVVSEART
jgi:hypothetical protein